MNFYSHEGRIDAQHKEIQEEELVSKETIEELTTSKALHENEKPQKQTVAASTPPYDNEVITKLESQSGMATLFLTKIIRCCECCGVMAPIALDNEHPRI